MPSWARSVVTSILIGPTSSSGDTRVNTPFAAMPKRPLRASTSSMAPSDRSFTASLNGTSMSASTPLTFALPSSEIAHR